MRQSKWFRRAAGMSLVCASVVSIAPFGGSTVPVASAQAAVDPGGEFHALTPTRIFDTRPATSVNDVRPKGAKRIVPNAAVDTSAEFQFNPLGKGNLPTNPSDVLAIVANVTITQPTVPGWVAVYPTGFDYGGPDGKAPTSSLVNFARNESVSNLVVVGLDSTGSLTINAGSPTAGSYHVIIDLVGFVSTSQYSTAGARLETVDPGRVLDTRFAAPVGPGQSYVLPIRGADTISGLPNAPVRADIVPNRATVTAVLVNLTLVNNRPTSKATYLSATPQLRDPKVFNPSNSNVLGGRIKANTAVVPVGADGKIRLFNAFGDVDVVVDVLGYFETGINTTGNRGRIVPLEAPFRAMDTRGDGRLQHGSKEEWSFSNFVQSVVLNPGAANETAGPAQQGLLGSLVAIDLDPLYISDPAGSISFLRITPANGDAGATSNLNFYLHEVTANMSLVKYGTSGTDNHVIEAYNRYGQIDYLLDVYAIVLDD